MTKKKKHIPPEPFNNCHLLSFIISCFEDEHGLATVLLLFYV